MTKVEFLQRLSNSLSNLSFFERQEIIQDFEEHFSAGIDMGKTEEQICAELGTPEACAASYLANQAQPQTDATARPDTKPEPAKPLTYGASAPYTPTYQSPDTDPNKRRNQFIWRILFICFVVCAFGVYPTAIALMASPIIVLLAAIFMVAAVPTAAMIAFLISLSIALFTAGLLIFIIMTWLLKLSFKRAEF